MSSPSIISVFPSNSSTGVPVGVKIAIIFDRGVDLDSAKNNIVVYGGESEIMTGPNETIWLNQSDIGDSDFLKTVGFKGIVRYDIEGYYVDSVTLEKIESGELNSYSDEEYLSAYYKVVLTPKELLAELNDYKIYIIGEVEDNLKKGITKRTVYDPDYSSATSSTGLVFVHGGYEGKVDDKLYIKVTKSGNIGTCEFDYWFETDGESAKVAGSVTSRRYRKIKRNLQVRFGGSSFVKDDVYTVNVYTADFLETSYKTSFKTSSDFIEDVPDTMSTSPIGNKIVLTSSEGGLSLTGMSPEDGGTNIPFSEKTITLTFDNDIDDSTVDESSVLVYSYPVSGFYSGNGSVQEPTLLRAKITVEDNQIIIEV